MQTLLQEGPGALLEGPVHGLSHKVTGFELQCWDNSLKNAGDIQGGAELTVFMVRTGGAEAGQLSPGIESHLCSSVEHSTHPAGRYQIWALLQPLFSAFPHKWPASTHAVDFANIS